MTHRNLGAGLLTALALAWPVDIAMMPSPASASISTDFSAQRRAPDAPDHLLRIDVVLPVRPGDRVPITVRHAGAGLVPRAIPGVRAELSPQERRLASWRQLPREHLPVHHQHQVFAGIIRIGPGAKASGTPVRKSNLGTSITMVGAPRARRSMSYRPEGVIIARRRVAVLRALIFPPTIVSLYFADT